MERSLTFTVDNGVAQSADGSLPRSLQLPSGRQQHDLQEQDEAEFLEDASDGDDDLTIREEIAQRYINREVTINLPPWAREVDFQELIARHRQEAHGGASEVVDSVIFVVAAASDAAVAWLEKQAFHATMAEGYNDHETGCAICLEDFEDGEEVTVMPCSRGHEFHPDCITKWLGKSNTCPLCRHALPTDDVTDDWMYNSIQG